MNSDKDFTQIKKKCESDRIIFETSKVQFILITSQQKVTFHFNIHWPED